MVFAMGDLLLLMPFIGDSDGESRDSEGERKFENFEEARLEAQSRRPDLDGEHDPSLSISLEGTHGQGSDQESDPDVTPDSDKLEYNHQLCQYDGICTEVIWAHDPGCFCNPTLTARCFDHIQYNCLRCTYGDI